MCGRTTSYTPPQRLAEVYDADLAPEALNLPAGPHWNVGPTNNLFGLAAPRQPDRDGAPLVIDAYRWGLIPSWSHRQTAGNLLFNARAETVATKPAFRQAFRSRRLAVLVDGFYEWRKDPGGSRQPFYFRRGDGYPLAFAGLWEIWKNPETRSWVRSCTIVTTTAGPDMEGIHDRMPVVLERHQLDAWVRAGADPSEGRLMRLLQPAPAGTLLRHPVDPRVGNVRYDDPGLLQPVRQPDAGCQQQTLPA